MELHPGSTNAVYHSHAEPFNDHASEHAGDDHEAKHAGKTITAFEAMLGIVQAHSDSVVDLAKFSLPYVASVQLPEIEDSSNHTSRNAFDSLYPQPHKDYCVQSATNLSPPQSS
jgi:hypothetical protein